MNEHEKLDAALDLLTRVSRREAAAANDKYGQVAVCGTLGLEIIMLLAKCGRFKFDGVQPRASHVIYGYWRDEDPERKAAS